MTKDEFYDKYDFGVTSKETFEEYIIRVGEAINLYRLSFGEPSRGLKDKIIEIFEAAILHDKKFDQIYRHIVFSLKRKPNELEIDQFLEGLVQKLKTQLNQPIQKQLYGTQLQ